MRARRATALTVALLALPWGCGRAWFEDRAPLAADAGRDAVPVTGDASTDAASTNSDAGPVGDAPDAGAPDAGAPDARAPDDAALPPGASSCAAFAGPWTLEPPTPVSELNTAFLEHEAFIADEGLTIYFARDDNATFSSYKATRSTVGATFDPPVLNPELANPAGVGRFAVTPDNLAAFVSAEWAGGLGNDDVWVAVRGSTSEAWTFTLATELDSPTWEYDPFPSVDGLRAYYMRTATDQAGPGVLLWAERPTRAAPFGAPAPLLAAGDRGTYDDNPALTEDERVLFFSSTRPGGPGAPDIWYATRADRTAPFGTPQLAPAINSSAWDYELTIWRCEVYFSSDRDGSADIFHSRVIPR